MNEWLKAGAPATGSVVAAIMTALCCAGPVLAVAVGVSGAGLVSTFEPLRPHFLIATGGFLVLGFWLLHRKEQKAVFAAFPSWLGLASPPVVGPRGDHWVERPELSDAD